MIPCCLRIVSCDEFDSQQVMVGGSIGKTHGQCPSDAEQAHEIIQASVDGRKIRDNALCLEPAGLKTCKNGECTLVHYDPCDGKRDGEFCWLCAPGSDCVETQELKTCKNGECTSGFNPGTGWGVRRRHWVGVMR